MHTYVPSFSKNFKCLLGNSSAYKLINCFVNPKLTEWRHRVIVSGRPDEHDYCDTDESGENENDERDDDDDGGVAQQPMLERVVRTQLHDGSTQDSPGEEALASGADPRLKHNQPFVYVLHQ